MADKKTRRRIALGFIIVGGSAAVTWPPLWINIASQARTNVLWTNNNLPLANANEQFYKYGDNYFTTEDKLKEFIGNQDPAATGSDLILFKDSGYLENGQKFIEVISLTPVTMNTTAWNALYDNGNGSNIVKIDGETYTYYSLTQGEQLDQPGFFSTKPTQTTDPPDAPATVMYKSKDDNEYFTTQDKVIDHVEEISLLSGNNLTFTNRQEVMIDGIKYTYYEKMPGGRLQEKGFFTTAPTAALDTPSHNFDNDYLKISDPNSQQDYYFGTINDLLNANLTFVDGAVRHSTLDFNVASPIAHIDSQKYKYIPNGTINRTLTERGYFSPGTGPNTNDENQKLDNYYDKPDLIPKFLADNKYFASKDVLIEYLSAEARNDIWSNHKVENQVIKVDGNDYTYYEKYEEDLSNPGFYKNQPNDPNDEAKAPAVTWKYNNEYYTTDQQLVANTLIQETPSLPATPSSGDKIKVDGIEYIYHTTSDQVSPGDAGHKDTWKMSIPDFKNNSKSVFRKGTRQLNITNKTNQALTADHIKDQLVVREKNKHKLGWATEFYAKDNSFSVKANYSSNPAAGVGPWNPTKWTSEFKKRLSTFGNPVNTRDFAPHTQPIMIDEEGWYIALDSDGHPEKMPVKNNSGSAAIKTTHSIQGATNEYYSKLDNVPNLLRKTSIDETSGNITIDGAQYTYFLKAQEDDLENPGFFKNKPNKKNDDPDQLTFVIRQSDSYFSTEALFFTENNVMTIDPDRTDYHTKKLDMVYDFAPGGNTIIPYSETVDYNNIINGGYYLYDDANDKHTNFSKDSTPIFADDGTNYTVIRSQNQSVGYHYFLSEDSFKTEYKITIVKLPQDQTTLSINGTSYTKYETYDGINMDSGKAGLFENPPINISQIPDKDANNITHKVEIQSDIFYFTNADLAIEKAEPYIEEIQGNVPENSGSVTIDSQIYTWYNHLDGSPLTPPGFFKNQPTDSTINKTPAFDGKDLVKESDVIYFTDKDAYIATNQITVVDTDNPIYVKGNSHFDDFNSLKEKLPDPTVGAKITVDGIIYTGSEQEII